MTKTEIKMNKHYFRHFYD